MPGASAVPDPHEFVFELDRAIRDQVLDKLQGSPELALARDVAPRRSGVYVLYHNGALVYVGKASRETTESERDLRGRLNEHVSKINGRKDIALLEMRCRFLTIESDWFVWAAERALITHFSPNWNASGFGNKDYGRGRDKQAPSDFDRRYPIDETHSCGAIEEGSYSVHRLLSQMKRVLPYVFRYQTRGSVGGVSVLEHYQSVQVEMPQCTPTAEGLLQRIVNSLGDGWQGTVFKSHMILYRESDDYDHAVRVIRHETPPAPGV